MELFEIGKGGKPIHRRVINNLLYDTSKAEIVTSFTSKEIESYGYEYNTKKVLYVTSKKNWFIVNPDNDVREVLVPVTEQEVIDILQKLGKLDLIIKHFEIEEA